MNYVKMLQFLVTFAMAFSVLEGQKDSTNRSGNSSEIKIIERIPIVEKGPSIQESWINLDKLLKSVVGKVLKRAMPVLMREIYQRNISAHCLNSLLQLSQALKKTKLWAFQMLDACGKIPEGFLAGGLSTLGNYEECINIFVNETRTKMQGQYCSIHVKPPLPEWKPFTSMYLKAPELVNISKPDTMINYLMGLIHNLHVVSIKLGLCVPSTCSSEDLRKLLQIIPEKLSIDVKFDVNRCEIKQVTSFTRSQKIILYALGIISFLIICGTLVDRLLNAETTQQKNLKGNVIQLLLCFSFLSNARKLSRHVYPEENLRFVDGVKFVLLLWIVISNTFMYVNYDVSSNFVEALNIASNLFYELVLNRTAAIQTFFFFSGFVTTYKWMKSPEQNLCIWKHILKRYWRYTPAYLLVIAVVMLMPHWGSGPTWLDHMNQYYKNCKTNWWTNVLYINNFIDSDSACLDHTWMFAVDAQLHLLGIFVLIPLKARPKIGLTLNFFLIGASLVTIALTNVYYHIPPNEMLAFIDTKDRNYYAHHTYFRVYTHASMYCAGIAVGYLLAEKPKLKISVKMSILLWLLSISGALATLCTVHEWRTGLLPSDVSAALYAALSKATWAACIAWLAVACAIGRGGTINEFLSWRPFAFFGRLVFIGYIVHPIVIQMVNGFKKSHVYVQEFELLYTMLSHIAATYILAYIFYVSFEAPLLSMTSLIRKKTGTRTLSMKMKEKSDSEACNGVMTEKPMTYQEMKRNEKQAQQNINKTKC